MTATGEDDKARARAIKDVGPGFSAFLRREMSCEASGCHWQWFAEGHDNHVGCRACGSGYPWRDTYYLRRIYMAEQEIALAAPEPQETPDDGGRNEE